MSMLNLVHFFYDEHDRTCETLDGFCETGWA